MIEIKYLSDEENYATVLEALKGVLGKRYTGSLNKEKYPPYWVDAIAVYKDDELFDIQLYDPYDEVAHGVFKQENGRSEWLYHLCDDDDKMKQEGLSPNEANRIKSLSEC